MHGAGPVEPAVAVEGDEVVAGPVVGAGQPEAELLAADQRGLGGDADDVGVAGEVDRGSSPLSPSPATTTRGGVTVRRRGGRGTSIGTRSMTSW